MLSVTSCALRQQKVEPFEIVLQSYGKISVFELQTWGFFKIISFEGEF